MELRWVWYLTRGEDLPEETAMYSWKMMIRHEHFGLITQCSQKESTF